MKPSVRSLFTGSLLVFAATPAHAQTWDGGGTDNNFGTANNWNTNANLVNNGSANVIMAGLVRLSPNLETNYAVNTLTFNNTAGAFAFTGSQLGIGAGGLVNNDADSQTFGNLVAAAAAQTVNAASGPINFNGGLAIGANAVTLSGASAISLASLSGTGTITKNSAGNLTLTASATPVAADLNLNSGNTILVAGSGTQVFASTSAVVISGTSNLTLNTNATFDGGAQLTKGSATGLTISPGSTLTLQGGSDLNFPTGHTFSGGTVMVSGAGSTVQSQAALSLTGGASLSVASGASASSAFYFDVGVGSSASLLIDGGGSGMAATGNSWWGSGVSTTTVTFSNNAIGSLTGSLEIARTAGSSTNVQVLSGAAVYSNGVALANTTDAATGVLRVAGPGTTWFQSSGNLVVGAAAGPGSAELRVENGGLFMTSITTVATVNKTGTLNLQGGSFSASNGLNLTGGLISLDNTGNFTLPPDKTLAITSGGRFQSATSYTHNSGSTISVDGVGSTVAVTGALSVVGDSNLSATGGAAISSFGLNLGYPNGGGTLTLNGSTLNAGAGSTSHLAGNGGIAVATLSNNAAAGFDDLAIGNNHNAVAALNMLSGSSLTADNIYLCDTWCNSSSVTLTIDGVGSRVTLNDYFDDGFILNQLVVGGGQASSAALKIKNSGLFASGYQTYCQIKSHGLVAIASNGVFNASGLLAVNGGQLQLDATTNGRLNLIGPGLYISQGGLFDIAGSYDLNSGANITVSGAGSVMQATSALRYSGGSLSVTDGGAVNLGGSLSNYFGLGLQLGVDGAGSSLHCTSAYLRGTQASKATLSNGASVTCLGDISIYGGTATSELKVLSGASLTAQWLVLNLDSSIVVDGEGSSFVLNGGSVSVLGDGWNNGGTLSVRNGGTFTSSAAGVTINSGVTMSIVAGNAQFNGPLTAASGAITFASGSLGLVEDFHVGASGLLGTNLVLGTSKHLTTTATTTVDSYNLLAISGGSLTTSALVNHGDIAFTTGTLAVTGPAGFNIGSGALGSSVALGVGANLEVAAVATFAGGASLTLNGGSFQAGSMANSGTLRVNGGTAYLENGLTNNNGARVFVADTMLVDGASWLNKLGSRLVLEGGTGMIFGSAMLNNSGQVSGDGTIALELINSSGGEVRAEAGKALYFLSNGGNHGNTGRLNLVGGTLNFSDTVLNGVAGQINGTGTLIFPTTPVPTAANPMAGLVNAGQMNFSGGDTLIQGTVQMEAGSRLIASGGSVVSLYDVFRHSGTEVRASAGSAVVFFGEVRGGGSFTGSGRVYFEGGYSPGSSPAAVALDSAVTFGDKNQLVMEIGGVTQGTGYDQLSFGGDLTLGGDLVVELINGFFPSFGQSFDLFNFDPARASGTFTTISVIDHGQLPPHSHLDFSSLYTTGVVRVVADQTPIEQWRLAWFGDAANSGDGADMNDFDHDGTPNLLEYAFGMNPKSPGRAGLPIPGRVTVNGNDYLTLAVTRPLTATDVSYRFLVGATPVTTAEGSLYAPAGDVPSNAFTTEVSRSTSNDLETIVVRDNNPISGNPCRFMRVKVENP